MDDNATASSRSPTSHPWRSLVGLLMSAVILVALWYAHRRLLAAGAAYTGPLLVLDHLFAIALALAILAVCFGLGRSGLARCDVQLDRALDELLFATTLGAAALAVMMLALGSLGLFQPVTLVIFVALLAGATHRRLGEMPALLRRCVRSVVDGAGGRTYSILVLAILGVVAAALLVQAVTPPADWDSLMYHLEIPRQFLAEGRVHVPADNLHVAYVGLVHMLYMVPVALESGAAAAVLSTLFALLLGVAVFAIGARLFDGPTASVASVTLWATTGLLLVAITARLDVTLVLYLLLGHYALILAARDRSDRTMLYLAAILLGSSIAIKYHAMAYILALAPLGLWAIYEPERGLRGAPRSLRPLGICLALGLLAVGPWLLKNWLLLGAPLYPFLTDRILPPWLATIYGTRALPPGLDLAAYGALGEARIPFNLPDLFFAPGRLTVEPEGAHYHMNMLLLLLPAWVVFLRERALNWLIFPAVAYLLLIVVPYPSTNLRYLFAAIAPLTLASAFLTVRIAQRFFSAGEASLLLVALAVLTLYPSAKSMHFWYSKAKVLEYFAGTASRTEFLRTGYTFYSRVVDLVNRTIPSDARVLMLFEARGYYFEPTVLQDNELTNWALLEPAAERSDGCVLARADVSHVLLSTLAIRYYLLRGTALETFRWNAFTRYARACLRPIREGEGFVILEVRERPIPRPEPPAPDGSEGAGEGV